MPSAREGPPPSFGLPESGVGGVHSIITLMTLPPRAPELNPVENIWQFIRDNWLSNRVFKTYDDILAHCWKAWNKLAERHMATCPTGSDVKCHLAAQGIAATAI